MNKTKISAEVVADSINESGNRITTMVLVMPRFILAEFNTHRMFSRNSASSRAIPFNKMINMVKEDPFIPIAWQKDHKGMQGSEYFTAKEWINDLNKLWLKARDFAIEQATYISNIGTTKQLCNRLLEPFMWHKVLVTATEWENFFHLRCPQYDMENDGNIFRSRKDFIDNWAGDDDGIRKEMENYSNIEWLQLNRGQAEIHMMALAETMWDALNESIPKKLKNEEWHIPFSDNITLTNNLKNWEGPMTNYLNELQEHMVKVSTARCARVSYTTVDDGDKVYDVNKDIELHDRLAKSGHWSPFEHCAKAMPNDECYNPWSGNFKGWVQYRKTFEGENKTTAQ